MQNVDISYFYAAIRIFSTQKQVWNWENSCAVEKQLVNTKSSKRLIKQLPLN